MKNLSRLALTIGAAALIVGCGGSQPQLPIAIQGATRQDRSIALNTLHVLSKENVLHSFASGDDGDNPVDAPIAIGDSLYGTAGFGGDGCLNGCGVVYKVSASGRERILYAFKGGSDGDNPSGSLIDVNGVFYGSTLYGGGSDCRSRDAEGCGTLFELAPSGKERVLYRFLGKTQGAMPISGLTHLKDAFYGEAAGGGMGKCSYASHQYRGCGLLFKWSQSKSLTIVYTFKGGGDGATPQGGLLLFEGRLYGTTSGGGSQACYFNDGCGTVFRVTPSGQAVILHRFTGSWQDGAVPLSGLVVVRGNLYGTTISGGKHNCGAYYYLPCGTVFEVTPSGEEQVIYNFRGGADGAFPNTLIAVDGKLYGTTRNGGGSCGCGTVFEVTPSGRETILYQFRGGTDASVPYSGLIDAKGVFYGTTIFGGDHDDGTLYSLAL